MPVPVQHFQPLSLEQVSPLGYAVSQLPSVVDKISNQYNTMQKQKMQKALYDQQQKENALRMQYLEPQLKADLAYKQAEIDKQKAMANLPFGGNQLPGVAGQVMGLESIAKQYGRNSPQYMQAKNAFDLDQMSQRQQMNYQNALTQSMPERYLTPTARGFVEEARINQGMSPTGQSWGDLLHIASTGVNPQTGAPYSKKEMSDVYQQIRLKNSTDPKARERNLFATNIEKTIDRINPDDLTRYAGAGGATVKGFQTLLNPFHQESKNYDNYLKAVKNSTMLAKQVRQFYGDSIQPEMEEKLADLTNPANWETNPEQSKDLFTEFKTLLKNEMQTYRDALKGTSVYQGGSGTKNEVNNDPLGIRS